MIWFRHIRTIQIIITMVALLSYPVAATKTGTASASKNTDDKLERISILDAISSILAGLPDRITAAIAEDRLVSVSMAVVLTVT